MNRTGWPSWLRRETVIKEVLLASQDREFEPLPGRIFLLFFLDYSKC